jgi:hypothetical protein
MGRSLARFAGPRQGSFEHSVSGTKFTIKPAGETADITLTRDGLSGSFPVDYVIGSGSHAYGYLVRVGNYLFQAPLSYYTQRRAWDVPPGYEPDPAPDFNRPVTAECVQCHSGSPRAVAGTLNRFEDPPFAAEGITCDRCHGDPSAHLGKPSRQNIVNPARLPERARDSVCEQCHLSGEARVLNPGRQWSDFRPGQELEEVFSVYVRDTGTQNASFKVVSHAEQLAHSRCARGSEGKLWCGTCHDPHQSTQRSAADYGARCLSCHGERILKTHAKSVENCVGCHMLRRPAKDGAHTVFTDHRISRKLQNALEEKSPISNLVAWKQPRGPLALRNLGLANIEVGERDHSADLMEQGARKVVEAMKSLPPDPVMLTKVGLVLLRKGEIADATEVFEYALHIEAAQAGSHVNLGNAYREAGLTDKAVAEYERAIELDPSLESAYRSLGEIYARANDAPRARATMARYLKFMPQSVTARKAMAAFGGGE